MENNIFGKNLKSLRVIHGLSQKALGESLNVCNQTISFWELGAREPDLDALLRIARYFEVSVDELLTE